jgi:hypothetical protein
MLPFLKLNKEASSSEPVESVKRKPDDGSDYDGLEAAAEDLCNAIESKDYKAAAAAIRAAFELCDSAPHEEGPHIG